jgi:hypothetical protein
LEEGYTFIPPVRIYVYVKSSSNHCRRHVKSSRHVTSRHVTSRHEEFQLY